ncbi:hypothetical protein QAD02_016036 [Eretmocerus hayati]|uniref:Uncharacterized protein n=1 Tax=Eretmocerus hayati TaxID=131215 RepID=A0ACC2PAC1_9HYME|nr:hypothetical protein QAD02_016036 [Eretmocerus hayati]
MSSIHDLSLMSGISNISRISKTNYSVQYKYDSTCNTSGIYRDVTEGHKCADPRKVSESAKVSRILATTDESTCNYAILKFIYQCLEDVISENTKAIRPETMEKLKELLVVNKISKYLHLPNNAKESKEELTVLGIIDLPKHAFTYEELLIIRSCLEAKLRERIHSFLRTYESIAGSIKVTLKKNESLLCTRFQQKGELEHVHWKDKIDEIGLEYQRDLTQSLKLLHQWGELKNKLSQDNIKDAEILLLRAEVAETKAVITKLSCTLRMYQETPVTLEAFQILSSSLDDKISSVSEEILEKSELKKSYDALNNTEYDEILRKYLELCHVVEKKRTLLSKF